LDVDKELLDELIALMQRDGLDRLRVATGDLDLDLRMSAPAVGGHTAPAPAVPASSPKAVPSAVHVPANVQKVEAPLVGVFYRAPAPGAKPFVEVGDDVVAGQVLCIIEAMKLMNEIVAELSGRVAKICVNDGQLVSLHQELFWIET
jgi:acetyl-CoA carboxylase biotin carboxyl carrier protein